MVSETERLKLIVETFGLPEQPRFSEVPKELLLEWMQTDDLEILGSLYSFITKPNYASRIHPPLTSLEYSEFLFRYFDYCLRLNPDGEWSHSRYAAGWDIASWFAKLWRDQDASSQETLYRMKMWLAHLYKEADEELRRCIVDATLEHLFENREIFRFFSDWKNDAELAIAYAEAAEWAGYSKKARYGGKEGGKHRR